MVLPNIHLPEFAALLRECTGQDADLVGEIALARAVREGMARAHVDDPRVYLLRLRTNRIARQRFINALTIGESWFFRDEAPFAFLIQHLSGRARVGSGGAPVELLSLPCASGEETYSLAATAREAGLTPLQCRIEGIDINTACLRHARKAIYQGHAFRSIGPDRLLRYFDAEEQGYRVKSWLRDYVTFFHGSVINPDARLLQRRYDVILFRNLLIYLSAEVRRQVLALIRSLLKPDGLVIVGHAETGLMAATGFAPEGTAHSFAFCRAPPAQASHNSISKMPYRAASDSTQAQPKESQADTGGRPVQRAVGATLQEVEQLANAGDIEEAQRRCGWLLATSGGDPEVCYLCAIVAEAAGDRAQAEVLLREAIKTCPEHYPALVHLAATLAGRGADAEATELRRRAQQLADTGGRT